MINKFLKLSFWYNFFTNRAYKLFTILFIVAVVYISYYSFYYNKSNKGNIFLKKEIDTRYLTSKEIKEYMEKNGFDFLSGNPVYASNMTLINDGVAFRRYKNDDGTVQYQYCNTSIYPTCVNSDLTIDDLPKYYNSKSDSYYRIVDIYKDYQKKLDQLHLTHNQIKNALDYHYYKLYG